MVKQIDNAFYDQAGDIWWDDRSPLSCLNTALNPARFPYFRDVLVGLFGGSPSGKLALDVGCGGGLLSEEFARLGCMVTGIDPSANSLATARAHATESGLAIDYRHGTGEALTFEPDSFDIVFCCDVLEHVSMVAAVVAEVARVLKPGGVFLYDTINRTLVSKLAVVKLPQDWLKMAPPNFHLWEMFIKPRELVAALESNGLDSREVVGLRPGGNPLELLLGLRRVKAGTMSYGELGRRARWSRSRSLAISYMGYAVKGTQ
ncbi:MAG: 3-demethylubiquinone-9 3-O-methyltransferase [Candidatus Nephthysia bennettiae]|nr:MAG: 3-demethylubiquinone-9 3-O-methyltransferase [Candidatus Dormibacteraeota bacterium]